MGVKLLTATQSFCILHTIKHAVHTLCLERNAKMTFCVFLRLEVSLVVFSLLEMSTVTETGLIGPSFPVPSAPLCQRKSTSPGGRTQGLRTHSGASSALCSNWNTWQKVLFK